jgi:hypothetical protein
LDETPRSRAKLSTSRRVTYRVSGFSPSGDVVVSGTRSRGSARKRSIAAYTMPPQTPLLASPIGIDRPMGSGMLTMGTPRGNRLVNFMPDVLGRNPSTCPLVIVPPVDTSEEK